MKVTLYSVTLTLLLALTANAQDASSLRGGDRLLQKKGKSVCMKGCTTVKNTCLLAAAGDPALEAVCMTQFKGCKTTCK